MYCPTVQLALLLWQKWKKKKKNKLERRTKWCPHTETHPPRPPTSSYSSNQPHPSHARLLWACYALVDQPVESVRDFLLARRPLGFHRSIRRTLASKSGELLLAQFASDNWTTQRASWFVPSGVVSLVEICTHPFMQEHCRTQCTAFGQLICFGPKGNGYIHFLFILVFRGFFWDSIFLVYRGLLCPTWTNDMAYELRRRGHWERIEGGNLWRKPIDLWL